MQEKFGLSIYLGHYSEPDRKQTAALLAGLGHRVVFETGAGAELIQACIEAPPDLMISSCRLLDMDALAMLQEAYRFGPFPVILTSARQEEDGKSDLLNDNVMICLTEPLREDDLQVNIPVVFHRFREFQALWNENRKLKDALETRKAIEKAKGILMRTQNMDEVEAYQFIKTTARDTRTKMAEIASRIIHDHDKV